MQKQQDNKPMQKVKKELLVLIGMISDPKSCPYFLQLKNIRDHFIEIPPSHLLHQLKHILTQ